MSKSRQPEDNISTQLTPSSLSKPHAKLLQSFASRAVQHLPSQFRLHHTQSAPRIISDETDAAVSHHTTQKSSSSPLIDNSLDYTFEVSVSHHTTATPAPRQSQESMFGSVCVDGRHDLTVATNSVDKSCTNASQYQRYNQNNEMPTRTRVLNSSSSSVVSPMNICDITPSRREPPTYYFTYVHAAAHVDDEEDHNIADQNALREEREGVESSLNERPVLKQILLTWTHQTKSTRAVAISVT
jgi:hypothetical protein